MKTMTKVFRIHRLPDGRFESRNEYPTDSRLGVDNNLGQAIDTAVREATLVSKELNCRVVVEVQQQNVKFRQEQVVNPPAQHQKAP